MELEPNFPVLVGTCIYCGSTEDLSDEHVIPRSFGGTWILRKASCKRCRDITAAFEGRVFGRGLGDFRTKLGFPSRRKRPSELSITLQVGDEQRVIQLPATEHPGGVIFPVFGPPLHLAGADTGDELVVTGNYTRWHTPSVVRLNEIYGASAVGIPLAPKLDIARALAKIGYAFAVGCLDGRPDAFEEVYVRPTIEDGGLAGRYVGCLSDLQRNDQKKGHSVTMVQAHGEVTAYIRLMAEMDFPEYTVLVGRLRGFPIMQETGSTTAA